MEDNYYELSDVWGKLRITQNAPDTLTIADCIEYVRDKCKHCYENDIKCDNCPYHKMMINHLKRREFARYVYKCLNEYGNCYISQTLPLTEEQVFDLKVYGFVVRAKKAELSGGQILEVVRRIENGK